MVGGWALDVARDPVGSVRRGITTARSTAKMMEPTLSVASPVMRERSSARRFDCFEVPLDDLKRAAKVAEGTVNDVFLAAMSGGLARYHEQHGEPVAELRVTVPVSIRAAGDATGGNRITAMRFALPTAVADPDERVAAIHDQMVTLRHDPAIPVTDAVADVIGRLPAAAVSSLFGTMLCNIDFLASNVPGFPEAPYVAGARADRWFAFGPTEGSALNVTLLSHGDVCCVGVTSDVAAVADPELLTSCLQAEFEALIERAV
jgi:WS/DGAT/MGAT family acyltransferase